VAGSRRSTAEVWGGCSVAKAGAWQARAVCVRGAVRVVYKWCKTSRQGEDVARRVVVGAVCVCKRYAVANHAVARYAAAVSKRAEAVGSNSARCRWGGSGAVFVTHAAAASAREGAAGTASVSQQGPLSIVPRRDEGENTNAAVALCSSGKGEPPRDTVATKCLQLLWCSSVVSPTPVRGLRALRATAS